ncbi:hypothetical protein F2P45_29690 [Massilia sp. CCM 8733]|uniref:Uncharacterized protein n=1 Tax=Massilia mucilaginosa TaxID=2609282 RepID=A0ABX0P215_9BURK|nr:hypothetical protein [Massilia mucilaginosa]NHZ93152.1 hypothetical protein [Massilia mucilaginosa]
MLADDQKVDLETARGMLVYRDAALPTLFHYAATRPAIARGDDGTYQLTLVHYDRPIDGLAGMLSLVVDLRPDPVQMDNMERELAALHPGADLQFQPIAWSGGTVAAAIIGGGAVSATPSLLGQNAAALAIGLTTDQYVLLRGGAGTPQAAPVQIVYSLSYAAMRRSYGATIRFDESKFRDWVQKKCSANFVVISVEKSDTFEQLRQDGVLRVESVNQSGDEAPPGLRDAFLRSLQSILTPLPRFAQAPEASSGNWLLGFDCASVHDVQNMSRRLDTDMQVTGAVARTAVLQGAPDGLAEALAQRPDIELSTGASFTQPLTVRCHDRFGGRPLRRADVRITPAPSARDTNVVGFTAPTDAATLQLTRAPDMAAAYSYDCTLYFGADAAPCRSGAIAIAPGQAYLDVVPARWYTYRQYLAGVADDFPWDLVRSVRLELNGPAALAYAPAVLDIDKYTAALAIDAFAPSAVDLDAVGYTATYTPRLGASFSVPGQPAGAAIFLNPLRRRRVTFGVAAGYDWRHTSAIDVVLAGAAGNPQLWGDGKLCLTPAQPRREFIYWYAFDKTLSFRWRVRDAAGTASAQILTTSSALDVIFPQPPAVP